MLGLEKLEKISIMMYRERAADSKPWMKVVSSAYCSKGTPPGNRITWYPDSKPLEQSFVMQNARVSTANINMRGAR